MTKEMGLKNWEYERKMKEGKTMTEEIDPEIKRKIYEKSRKKELKAAIKEFRGAINRFMDIADVNKNTLYLKNFGRISNAVDKIEERVHWGSEFIGDDDD